jgi:ubiquinone biosynthesis protein UbiJ
MKSAKSLFLPLFVLLLSGCMGYRVGSTLDPSIQTVSVRVENKTNEPSIEVEVMKALRAEIQMDGRLKIASQDEADAELSVTLTDYNLNPLAYDRRRGTLAREYRVVLAGRAVLRNAETGEVILERPSLRGEADFIYAEDLTTAKLEALPEAAKDLARKVISTTVYPW